MKQILTLSIFAILLFAGSAAATEKSKIELTDGSVITGEVLEMSGGVYRIRTESMGDIKVQSNRIRSIMSGSSPHRNSDTGSNRTYSGIDNAKVESIQKELISDPKMMELIQAMMTEPELQEMLKDPSMLEKINAGDTKALENDPSFQKFMNHPKVKEIIERAKSKN